MRTISLILALSSCGLRSVSDQAPRGVDSDPFSPHTTTLALLEMIPIQNRQCGNPRLGRTHTPVVRNFGGFQLSLGSSLASQVVQDGANDGELSLMASASGCWGSHITRCLHSTAIQLWKTTQRGLRDRPGVFPYRRIAWTCLKEHGSWRADLIGCPLEIRLHLSAGMRL